MEYAEFENGNLLLMKEMQFDSGMGKRAGKIYRAANNVAKLLADNSNNLYLNLKVEL